MADQDVFLEFPETPPIPVKKLVYFFNDVRAFKRVGIEPVVYDFWAGRAIRAFIRLTASASPIKVALEIRE